MIYTAAIITAIVLIGGILWLLSRGAERRERARWHRRGIRAGDGVAEGGAGYAAASGSWSDGGTGNWDSGSCDSGGGSGDGGGGGCD